MGYIYEVETRFFFMNEAEAFEMLPFLKPCLRRKVEWETIHYGRDVFARGYVIRTGTAIEGGERRRTLGYKEPDSGESVNIRREYGERIESSNKQSEILGLLGGKGATGSYQEVREELESLGHMDFMRFSGVNLLGKYEPLGMDFKLMHCSYLRYPLLVEAEKEALDEREALNREQELMMFIREYGLESRVVKEEPPTLLYERLFSERR